MGNKYITVNDNIRFSIANGFTENTDFGSINYELHLSKQNALDAIEKDSLFNQCRKSLDYSCKKKYTLSQLRRIADILNEKDNNNND